MENLFFDDHPEFLETSKTASSRDRLNLRYLGLIAEHADVLSGARVLDIASHDGRWSFAALKAGASHVTGIEGRRYLVANARRTLAAKGIEGSRFRFIHGDAHDKLTPRLGKFDVVMCLGFLYHTLRYAELFAGIRATEARHVIIDTLVTPGKEGVVKLMNNPNQVESMAVADRLSYKGRSLVGTPDEAAVVQMLDTYGYEVQSQPDWAGIRSRHPDLTGSLQYERRERVAMLAVSRD